MRIKIYVDGSAAQVVASPHPLTKGMVGIECELDYSSEWSGLIRNACARATKGATVVAERTVLGITDTFTVPHEALAAAGCKLEIGIEGRKSDGTVVIPTEWAYVGRVIQGVEDNASETTPPTPSQLTQLQAAINAKPSQSYVDNALADKADADDLDVLTETVAGLDNDLEETTAALAGKANTVHQHQVSDVTGLQTALDAKQKKLTAGQNITIAEDGTISAEGGGTGPECDFFAVAINSTTFAEIQQAFFVDRKIVIAYEPGNPTAGFYPLAGMGANGFEFLRTWVTNLDPPVIFYTYYYCSQNGWTSANTRVPYVKSGASITNLDNTSATAATGKVYASSDALAGIDERVAALEEAEPSSGVTDVKVGTASVVVDGVAKISNGNGIYIDSQGKIQINDPTDGYIYNRSVTHGVLCSKIDKIVKAALCDGRGADYTETEQAAARARLGISIWDGSVSET